MKEDLVKDPVCGMVKNRPEMKSVSVFRGVTYYFCSEVDKSMFEPHPEHWIPRDRNEK